MPQRDTTETRAVTLVDIPLVRRLVEKGVILDSELICTRDVYGSNGAVLSSILLPPRGLHTLLSRDDKHQVIGQFRMRSDQPHAQILYLAPGMEVEEDDTPWLHMLDAMAREAGKHNAHALIAEVDEDCNLFETMRSAGFAVYARQQLWMRQGEEAAFAHLHEMEMTPQTDADLPGIYALFSSTVPRLVQQITAPSAEMEGRVYRVNDRIEATSVIPRAKTARMCYPIFIPMCRGRRPPCCIPCCWGCKKAARCMYVCAAIRIGWGQRWRGWAFSRGCARR
ncbi:hypothetical protein HC928_24360 [bacterium]|nr:hypothetical protein [bacterium]